MSEEYVESIQESALQEGKPIFVKTRSAEVCLIKFLGKYYAFSNTCTHIGGRLSEGRINKSGLIDCASHHAVFDIKDGKSVSFPRRGLDTFKLKIQDGKILIGPRQTGVWRAAPDISENDSWNI